ncbi:MAG: aminopeptidase P family protein [Gammaproteobacteria bacterium]|nr:aminopeptidase P family protein [Gammaproteobacteria bacterium]
MPLHFSHEEFQQRQAVTVASMQARELDGLLMFRQESMYYLTGYDSFAYIVFQCLYLHADGRMTLLVRPPDKYVALYTSTITDIRIWQDGIDDPHSLLRDILEEYSCRGKRIGVEYDAFGLRGHDALKLTAGLEDFCSLEDASDLITLQRVVKSENEIAYVKQAAILTDQAFALGLELVEPGAFEGDILAAMQAEILRQDGDYPGNEFVIGSGPAALLGRYTSGRRYLDQEDKMTIELAGVYRHYHACIERNICIGPVPVKLIKLYEVALEGMEAALQVMRPGNTNGDVYDAYARCCQQAGLEPGHSACGYGLGTTFAPSWIDWPFLAKNGDLVLQANMVFFLQTILFDNEEQLIACPGQTVLINDQACQVLSNDRCDLIIR